jgi:hypothetical protein
MHLPHDCARTRQCSCQDSYFGRTKLERRERYSNFRLCISIVVTTNSAPMNANQPESSPTRNAQHAQRAPVSGRHGLILADRAATFVTVPLGARIGAGADAED